MFEKCIEYGLHDTSADNIVFKENGIIFVFPKGVYMVNDAGKETSQTKPCRMNINIEDFDSSRFFEHCSFYKYYKKHFSEVEFAEIKSLLLKNSFDIDLDFYSPFARAILLKGYIGKYMVEILITEIQSIEFEIL